VAEMIMDALLRGEEVEQIWEEVAKKL